MKVPTRVYPIRLSKQQWRIPIFWNHQCCLTCMLEDIIIENESVYIINSSNVCDSRNKIEQIDPGVISPIIYNNLYDPDTVVIPDNEFSMFIYFPLSNPIDMKIEYPNGNMTKKTLLMMIRSIYEDIYKEEEITSTPHTYNIELPCDKCENKDISKDIKIVRKFKGLDECCICNENYTIKQKPAKLKCGHIFHQECINTWSRTSPTCPICRNSVISCDKCTGKGFINFDLHCKIIPPELRLFRNTTDGTYGIYGFDLEDLIIKDMIYNREQKRLYIDIVAPFLE